MTENFFSEQQVSRFTMLNGGNIVVENRKAIEISVAMGSYFPYWTTYHSLLYFFLGLFFKFISI